MKNIRQDTPPEFVPTGRDRSNGPPCPHCKPYILRSIVLHPSLVHKKRPHTPYPRGVGASSPARAKTSLVCDGQFYVKSVAFTEGFENNLPLASNDAFLIGDNLGSHVIRKTKDLVFSEPGYSQLNPPPSWGFPIMRFRPWRLSMRYNPRCSKYFTNDEMFTRMSCAV